MEHFGFERNRELPFGDLLQRWQDESGIKSPKWAEELYAEVVRAVRKSPAKPGWHLLKSVRHSQAWFAPVVNHVRVLPEHNCMEFDVYLYKMEVDADGRVTVASAEG